MLMYETPRELRIKSYLLCCNSSKLKKFSNVLSRLSFEELKERKKGKKRKLHGNGTILQDVHKQYAG